MQKKPETLSELVWMAHSGDAYAIMTPELARELGIDTERLEVESDDDDQEADAGADR